MESEFKLVMVNGERIMEPIFGVTSPNRENPYWKIWLKNGDIILASGQVLIRQGTKD
jgi:hypothetical protein